MDSDTSTFDPERHAREEALVCELVQRIEAVVQERDERSALGCWVRSVWPCDGPPLLRWSAAENILCCLSEIDRTDVIRAQDLRAYLRVLQEGEPHAQTPEALLVVEGELGSLRVPRRAESERFILDGLGWHEGLRLVSGATGRGFTALQPLPASVLPEAHVTFRMPRGDNALAAVWDLFELLGIDDSDAVHVAVEVRELPRWQLCRLDDNGQQFPLETSRSHSKLIRRQRAFEAHGHRQSYWVQRAV